jgi:hypothetical protein
MTINIFMHQHGTRKETNPEKVHGGLLALREEIKLQKQSHGNPDMMQRKIRVARQRIDIMFDFLWDGWMVTLGTSWLHCSTDHIVWFLLVFRGRNYWKIGCCH